jgi:acyl transferase domain-containing protein
VRFAQVVKGLIGEGHTVFVEMSPHPILQPSVEEILGSSGRDGVAVGSLRRHQGERRALLEALGALWVKGHPVAWDRQFPDGGRKLPLPTYAWGDRERYWLDGPVPAVRRGHPLLGESTRSSVSEGVTYWTNDLSIAITPYLEDHRVGGQVVFPAAGYVEMALQAGANALSSSVEIRDLEIEEALLLSGEERRLVQLVLSREGAHGARWQIASTRVDAGNEKWTLHARGRVERAASGAPEVEPLEPLLQRAQAEGWEAFEGDLLYARLAAGGLDYGETFRGVQRGWRRSGEALAELGCVGDAAKGERAYGIHPGLLDAALQVTAAALVENEDGGGLYLPVGMKEVRIARPPEGWVKQGRLRSHVRCLREGGELRSDVWVRAASGEVLAHVAGFRARRVQGTGAGADETTRWLYETSWEELERAGAGGAPADPRNWLVLADAGSVLQGVIDGLTAQGRRVVQVRRGEAFIADDGTGRAAIDPYDAGHYARLLRELPLELRKPGWGILHGFSLDDALEETTAGRGVGWQSALQLVQALVAREGADAPRLVVVTRGARSVVPADRLPGLAQTPVVGLCKTVGLEHPELGCLGIDLGGAACEPLDPADRDSLLDELGRRRREEELALRGGHVFVPRLARSMPRADEPPEPAFESLDPDAAYLITGGFGGLGLAVARWIAGHGARHVALLGRRGPDEAAQRSIDELRQANVDVIPLLADLANAESLRGALARVTAEGRALRGVFHLAGLLDNAVLSALTVPRFADVLAPKIQGTWNLEQATQDQPLDHFVLFSSVASVFGAPGQANHAAANAFLDGFAAHRAARGGKALSVNWGAWAEVGEAADGKAAAWVASRGLQAMAPEKALRAFARASARGGVQIAVVAFDKNGPADAGILDRPLFSRLVAELGPRRVDRGGSEDSLTRKAVLDAALSQRERLVANFLRNLVATQTGFAKARVDLQRPLTSLGLDSLMTLRLKNRIESSLGVTVPATLLLQGSTTQQLASRIVEMLGGEENLASTPAKPGEPSAPATRAALRRAAQTRRSGTR